jgi:hypothetical protein
MVIRRWLAAWCAGLGLTAMACAPHPTGPADVATATTSPTGPRSEPAIGPMLFPGERIEAQVNRGVLTVGVITLQVEAPCLEDGVEVVPILSHAERSGLYGAVTPGRVDTLSWSERATGLPRWARSVGETAKRTVDIAATFDPTEVHTIYTSVFHDGDKPPRTRRKSSELLPGELTYDGHAALGALRSWATAPGARGVMQVVLGRKIWRLELNVSQPTEVRVGGEVHEAILIEGTARRLTSKLTLMGKVRRWSIWISDDDRRLPLKARVDYRKETIDIELVDYDFEPPAERELRHCEAR